MMCDKEFCNMSSKSEVLEEDSRNFEGSGEEEGFYSFSRDEAFTPTATVQQQTWSPFEDLDDSGHFTASPDGEKALSGSSRSHSPCLSSVNLLLQMQHSDSNSVVNSQQQQCHLLQASTQLTKPLISPRSVMTVKVPQSTPSSLLPISTDSTSDRGNGNDNCDSWQFLTSRPATYTLEMDKNGGSLPKTSFPAQMSGNAGPFIKPTVLHSSASVASSGDGDAKSGDESCEYLRSILANFNSLYMEKLRMIDDMVAEGSDDQKKHLLEKKTNILENWAKDVCVQNMVLVHTVEELEREANRKVSALQKKMTESTQLAKEHMTMIKKYEEQVKSLLKNHSDTEERNLVLKIELEKLKSECRRVRDRMNLLLKDNESLLTLVCRIRDMGVWDVNGLELQRPSFDQIFGLYPGLVGAEVQTVFTREKARHVKETEERIVQMEQQLCDLQKSRKEVEYEVVQKDRKIEELEIEIKNVLNKAHYCEKECNDYKRSLLETQEKLLEATRQLTQSSAKQTKQCSHAESEITVLIKELRAVKSQLNAAVEEKQSAKEESNFFKRELSERLKQMHDIQNVFHSLATEVVTSRAAFQQVQEKEVQLQSLKSEVQTYQSRCVEAEDTIHKKEKEIKQLQKQMNEIHKRMFDLEAEWGRVFDNLEYSKNASTSSNIAKIAEELEQTEVAETKPGGSAELSQSATPTVEPGNVQGNDERAGQSSETKCQEDKESMSELLDRLLKEKQDMEEHYKRELEDKNIELKMQKVTIQHLQDAYVALKRGQPIPVPQGITGNKVMTNGSSNGHHKANNNNNNNNHSQVLDV